MNKTFTTSPTQNELKPSELEKNLAETMILQAERGPAPFVLDEPRDYLFTDKPALINYL